MGWCDKCGERSSGRKCYHCGSKKPRVARPSAWEDPATEELVQDWVARHQLDFGAARCLLQLPGDHARAVVGTLDGALWNKRNPSAFVMRYVQDHLRYDKILEAGTAPGAALAQTAKPGTARADAATTQKVMQFVMLNKLQHRVKLRLLNLPVAQAQQVVDQLGHITGAHNPDGIVVACIQRMSSGVPKATLAQDDPATRKIVEDFVARHYLGNQVLNALLVLPPSEARRQAARQDVHLLERPDATILAEIEASQGAARGSPSHPAEPGKQPPHDGGKGSQLRSPSTPAAVVATPGSRQGAVGTTSDFPPLPGGQPPLRKASAAWGPKARQDAPPDGPPTPTGPRADDTSASPARGQGDLPAATALPQGEADEASATADGSASLPPPAQEGGRPTPAQADAELAADVWCDCDPVPPERCARRAAARAEAAPPAPPAQRQPPADPAARSAPLGGGDSPGGAESADGPRAADSPSAAEKRAPPPLYKQPQRGSPSPQACSDKSSHDSWGAPRAPRRYTESSPSLRERAAPMPGAGGGGAPEGDAVTTSIGRGATSVEQRTAARGVDSGEKVPRGRARGRARANAIPVAPARPGPVPGRGPAPQPEQAPAAPAGRGRAPPAADRPAPLAGASATKPRADVVSAPEGGGAAGQAVCSAAPAKLFGSGAPPFGRIQWAGLELGDSFGKRAERGHGGRDERSPARDPLLSCAQELRPAKEAPAKGHTVAQQQRFSSESRAPAAQGNTVEHGAAEGPSGLRLSGELRSLAEVVAQHRPTEPRTTAHRLAQVANDSYPWEQQTGDRPAEMKPAVRPPHQGFVEEVGRPVAGKTLDSPEVRASDQRCAGGLSGGIDMHHLTGQPADRHSPLQQGRPAEQQAADRPPTLATQPPPLVPLASALNRVNSGHVYRGPKQMAEEAEGLRHENAELRREVVQLRSAVTNWRDAYLGLQEDLAGLRQRNETLARRCSGSPYGFAS
eukprot:TRINITY_DN8770_c0_g1_i1.p1 TRINITY_DN8770_c0_g1~~TRINITY_DN8770_c0_g1_i1.p1  ORF type:complete len:1008 (+),score=198.12 TRINITY_DN8770_c0_g1_i1:116-3025(+)